MKRWLAVAVLALLAVNACTKRRNPPTAPPPPAAPGLATVWMLDGFVFVPRDTTISRGDTVLWVNASAVNHTSTSGACAPCVADGLWHSGNMSPGATFRVVFGPGADQPGLVHVDSAGLFPYYCIPHQPNMAGSITVTP